MSSGPRGSLVVRLVEEVARLVPVFLDDPIDRGMSGGNAAFCAIDSAGQIYGRIFGENKAKTRACFLTASRKVVQVWATGCRTGEFEEHVYARRLDPKAFGLERPDLIGWEGGVPVAFEDGALLAAAFSGFRGQKDVEIVERAAVAVGLRPVARATLP